MITLEGVSKQYLYGARVLGSLDMTINDGQIVALLGDESSGKTTFLKVVASVTDCEGKVLFDGQPLAKKQQTKNQRNAHKQFVSFFTHFYSPLTPFLFLIINEVFSSLRDISLD